MMRRALPWVLPALLVLGWTGAPVSAEEAAPAPDFELTDQAGKAHKLSDFRGKWVVLEWTNYDCPFVKKHYHDSHKHMQALQKTYTDKGVVWLSICSSAPGKQGHMTAEQAAKRMADQGAGPTALLLDPTGKVGHAYRARTTPEMRIVDPKGHIVYRGAIDSVRSKDPADVEGATNYVAEFLDAALAGKAPAPASNRPYG